ncbi:hypothetical protein PI125_g26884 [Phytophthora idaei]|nr:hypothetical protein PI125_g26884 [Phytophthora idaei]KAG3122321.1 hypothetical protein PI126_g24195 [Phytophthora idaei]
MYEYQDAPTAGHPGREKTYVLLTRDFYWNQNASNLKLDVFAAHTWHRHPN